MDGTHWIRKPCLVEQLKSIHKLKMRQHLRHSEHFFLSSCTNEVFYKLLPVHAYQYDSQSETETLKDDNITERKHSEESESVTIRLQLCSQDPQTPPQTMLSNITTSTSQKKSTVWGRNSKIQQTHYVSIQYLCTR